MSFKPFSQKDRLILKYYLPVTKFWVRVIMKSVFFFFSRYKNLSKLCSNLKPFTVAWVLPKGRGGFVNAKVVTETINNYCSSTDECIGTQHVPESYKNTNGLEECPSESKKKVCRYPGYSFIYTHTYISSRILVHSIDMNGHWVVLMPHSFRVLGSILSLNHISVWVSFMFSSFLHHPINMLVRWIVSTKLPQGVKECVNVCAYCGPQ